MPLNHSKTKGTLFDALMFSALMPLALVTDIFVGTYTQAVADVVDIGHVVQASGNQIENTTAVVQCQSDGQTWVSNIERAQQRFSPASTSKIPHTLIALESGIANSTTVFAWDGFPKGVRAWNKDQSLSSAFKNSSAIEGGRTIAIKKTVGYSVRGRVRRNPTHCKGDAAKLTFCLISLTAPTPI